MPLATNTGLVGRPVTTKPVGRGSGRYNVLKCKDGLLVRAGCRTSPIEAGKRAHQRNRGASRKVQVNTSKTCGACGCRFCPLSHCVCFCRRCVKPNRQDLCSAFSGHLAFKALSSCGDLGVVCWMSVHKMVRPKQVLCKVFLCQGFYSVVSIL